MVCLGAEKNFNKFAERLEEDGEPVVDASYFGHMIAKAILWRTTEKLFDGLDLPQWRAETVAYALAWVAEQSGRRVDLEWIWKEQRLPPGLVKALEIVCGVAHKYINQSEGNPGEHAKKETCWKEFCRTSIDLPDAWRREWADSPFVAPTTEEEALAAQWEEIRVQLQHDARTIEGLEAYTGRTWVPKYRRESVSAFAALNWANLRDKPGLGLKKLRSLVEMFAIAVKDAA